MNQVHDELATLTADIQASLEWAELTGASVLPRERVEPLVAEPPTPRKVEPVLEVETVAPVKTVRTKPLQPSPSDKPQSAALQSGKEKRTKASAKWAALIDAPTTHTVSGPGDARLVILRGAGSSAEAESMLDRMLVNVLQIERQSVAVFDLTRDTRRPIEIGEGVRRSLSEYAPEVILVMGTFAVKALLNEDASVHGERGKWTSVPDLGVVRVTHHPEAILAMAERGDSTPKREAFDDLKAIASRLN